MTVRPPGSVALTAETTIEPLLTRSVTVTSWRPSDADPEST